MNRYRYMFGQMVRHVIAGSLVLSALLTASPAMAALNVRSGETYTVTGAETVGALDVQGTLIVESTGSLTFTSRSEVHGPDPGGHIIVNGGSIVGNARFDTDKTATITMNGGSFRVNNTFKFPDNAPGPVYIYLNGGVLSAQDIQTMPDRNPHYVVGGGVLRLDGDMAGRGRQYDPREWIDLGIMVPAEGYDHITVEYVYTGGYTEVRAISAAPQVQFETSASQALETVGIAQIPVCLSPAVSESASVSFMVTGGTATASDDYILAAGELVFDPDQTTPEIIEISIIDDSIPEEDETIEVTLYDPVNVQLGVNDKHTYTILDPHPSVSFMSSFSQDKENITHVNIPVGLSHAWSETVTVEYAATGGTATNGDDYNMATGTLVFEPNQLTPEEIVIEVIEDGVPEEDETVIITLFNPSANARANPIAQHTYQILDPSPKITFAVAAGSGNENVSPISIPVKLTQKWHAPVSVDYKVTGGTAQGGGVDYLLDDATLQFDAYVDTRSISIALTEDDLDEYPDETILSRHA